MDIAVWTLVLFVIAGAALAASAVERRTVAVQRRLGLLERKLDAVLEHLGVPVTEPGLEEVDSYLRQGKKIQAIKAYRESTGAGLQEAKEAVERRGGER